MTEENPKTVIIVDDDSVMRQALRLIVKEVNCQVIGEAGDGEKALELVERFKPDAVFLDIKMPRKSGLEALPEIKAISPNTVVVMISGETTRDAVQKSIESGAAGYIAKPFNAAVVLSNIQRLLGISVDI